MAWTLMTSPLILSNLAIKVHFLECENKVFALDKPMIQEIIEQLVSSITLE